jgi:hypothetical protein
MEHRRWWEAGGPSLEDEQAWFEEAGLEFELDRELLARSEVAVFRGVLRLGGRVTPATVNYSPAYAAGANPVVVAPELRLGRHQTTGGTLCLDHPRPYAVEPMCGAEAVERAQELWRMWESDRERLAVVEADVPDPRSIHYPYESDSAVVFADADVTGSRAGFLRLDAAQLTPLRAAVTEVRATVPAVSTHAPGRLVATFAGDAELRCPWRRLGVAPPLRGRELSRWLVDDQGDLVVAQLRYAREMVKLGAPPDLPALIAFVYPDEGPGRGQVHDAWLLIAIDARGRLTLPRAFHLRREDRWLRQPQLEPLGGKRVSIVGLGSLGSPIADLLAKAGIGGLHYVDYDMLGVGNRVRHQLDLGDLGRAKADAMQARTARVDPWAECSVHDGPLGEAFGGSLAAAGQHVDDLLVSDLARSDLIVNASADPVAGTYLSRIAVETGTPVLHAWVTAGAWGARLLVQRPGQSGCWDCLARAQADGDGDGRVPPVRSDPAVSEVAERGCADATFTGPGFELAAAAAAATRVAVQALLEEDGGYPRPHFDLLTLGFRSASSAAPESRATRLRPHDRCPTCSTSGPMSSGPLGSPCSEGVEIDTGDERSRECSATPRRSAGSRSTTSAGQRSSTARRSG